MAAGRTRTYRLRARAERQAETRRRILHAALELFGELGPDRTTISAIAARARVQRLTVYRHAPDDEALLEAAAAEHLRSTPLPDMRAWFRTREPVARLRLGLAEMFAYYRRTEPVTRRLVEATGELPALSTGLRPLLDALDGLPGALAEGWPTYGRTGRVRLKSAIRHAIRPATWSSFSSDGLSDADAVDLLVDLARVAARGEDG